MRKCITKYTLMWFEKELVLMSLNVGYYYSDKPSTNVHPSNPLGFHPCVPHSGAGTL